MTSPNQPINPQNPPTTTPSGGATPHEQSQWIIRTINEFTGKISALEAQSQSSRRDIERVEGETCKITNIDSNLSGVRSWVKGIGVGIAVIVGFAGWGGIEMYNLNKSNAINAEKISMMSKQLDESKAANDKIQEKLDLLLDASRANENK
ncbi:hypothetical protein K5N30_002732 [Vibrio parahaemolyticus]|nr:hypothetical protein [Vibrio parahaemolyticus]